MSLSPEVEHHESNKTNTFVFLPRRMDTTRWMSYSPEVEHLCYCIVAFFHIKIKASYITEHLGMPVNL